MRLGSKDGEAHHAMASLAFHYDRDFVTAEREFKSAIDLNHDAYTYFSYGWLLSQQGRHEEAVNALQQAVELDPRSPAMHTDLGWWLYGSRKYEQAIAKANKALEIFDQHPEAYWLLAAAESALGQHKKAIRSFERYEALYGSPVHWFRGYLRALGGNQSAALDAVTDLDQHIVQKQALPIDAAIIHVALGDKERALTIIEQSEDASVSFQPYLWPEYELLWNEPRFRLAVTRFGLPEPPLP
jgi:tetratricopeptide (TPR) repeat protein